MAKLKNIVSQLSNDDYNTLRTQLTNCGATKSSFLLQALREQKINDRRIIRELDMTHNAYYTLCSRLGQKIDEHLLSQMETPRTALLRKIANLHEIIYSNPRTIAVATLKKLEKELRSYNLSAELLLVYKYLKKFSVHSEERFHYSQAYNQQITYMLTLDKSEGLLMDYFLNYGAYYLQGDDTQKESLYLHKKQLQHLLEENESHRIRVHYAALSIFHRLYIEEDPQEEGMDALPTEHIFKEIYDYFAQYTEDPIYPHYQRLFDFLQLAYYHRYGIQRKVEQLYEGLVESVPKLLSHYDTFTFPSQMLWIMLGKHLRSGSVSILEQQNRKIFENYRPETEDLSNYINYASYRTLSCYYEGNYREAASWIQQVFNQVSFKSFSRAQVELKALLALQYALLDEYDLFMQTVNSLQRQLRLLGKNKMPHMTPFVKILKLSIQDSRKDRPVRMRTLAKQMPMPLLANFCPTSFVQIDETFTERMCKIRLAHH